VLGGKSQDFGVGFEFLTAEFTGREGEQRDFVAESIADLIEELVVPLRRPSPAGNIHRIDDLSLELFERDLFTKGHNIIIYITQ